MAPMASACPASLAIAVANAWRTGAAVSLVATRRDPQMGITCVRALTAAFNSIPRCPIRRPSATSPRYARAGAKADHHQDKEGLNTANRRMFYGRSVVDFVRSKEASTVSQRVIRPCVRMTAALGIQARRHNLERLSSGVYSARSRRSATNESRRTEHRVVDSDRSSYEIAVETCKRDSPRAVSAHVRADRWEDGDGTILLLTTTGRKSGKARTVPVLYFLDDNGDPVVTASNAGLPKNQHGSKI